MGNGPQLFYYRDQSGLSVGPLPLSEIRKFAEGGVIPNDVQITEVGRDNWRPLKSKSPKSNPSCELAKPPPVVIEVPPRGYSGGADAHSQVPDDSESPEVDLGEMGRELARDVGKGLWGCVIYPLIIIGSLYLGLAVIEWLYDKFWRIEIDLF